MIVLAVALSLACSSQVTVFETPAAPDVETAVTQTLTAMTKNAPPATNTTAPTQPAAPAGATPEKFAEVYVYTAVENVNLRTNPGTLFKVSRVMPQNSRLLLLGQAPGGEWLKVVNAEGIEGWVNSNVVLATYERTAIPIIEPVDVQLVTGVVETELGTPVSGIGFAVIQGTRRTDAVTDAEGRFYAYVPSNLVGTWEVSYASVSCASNTMDTGCNCILNPCGTAHPASATIELPQVEPLFFLWK